jgi:hypothetical protein
VYIEYMQGSFEKIQELSTAASLPLDYLQTAKARALDGCYVLGLSYKYVSALCIRVNA